MPELPEVEVTRLGVEPVLSGATLLSIWLGKPLRWPLGISPSELAGAKVRGVRRRGKYLLIDLDRGVLLVHLGMSGRLSLAAPDSPPGTHEHADLVTDRGTIRLRDPRRFGAIVFSRSEQVDPARKLLSRLGVEPLDDEFTVEKLASGLSGRRASIKQVLLAGDVVVGVGNIYASEALFLARIRPTTAAASISHRRVARLHDAIQAVLRAALSAGGSSLRDFRRADGQAGYFQLAAQVYDREGQPCRTCGTGIRAIRQGQRSTFFCPRCQAR